MSTIHFKLTTIATLEQFDALYASLKDKLPPDVWRRFSFGGIVEKDPAIGEK